MKTDAEILKDIERRLEEQLLPVFLKTTLVDLDKCNEYIIAGTGGENLDKFLTLFHNIKGQGNTFGYTMITDIGIAGCDVLRNRKDVGEQELVFIKLLLECVRIVITQEEKEKNSIIGHLVGQTIEAVYADA